MSVRPREGGHPPAVSFSRISWGGTGYPTYDLLESPQSTATDRAAHSAVMVAA